MRTIKDGKIYDTEHAESIAEIGFSTPGDFEYWSDELMRTKKGNFFLYCGGGPLSQYAEYAGNGTTTGSSCIKPLSREEAIEWLLENGKLSALEKYFPDEAPEEA